MPDERNVHTAEDFDKCYSERDWQAYKWILVSVIQWANPGLFLDIGAGMGFFVECCQQYGIGCIGIEASDYAIEMANERGITLEKLFLEEGTRLPFHDQTFSAVVSNQFAHHLKPDAARWMFSEVWRVLQDKGHFFVFEAHINTPNNDPLHGDINPYTRRRLISELKEVGFGIVAEPNNIKYLFGKNRISTTIGSVLFHVSRWEYFLRAANVIARKP